MPTSETPQTEWTVLCEESKHLRNLASQLPCGTDDDGVNPVTMEISNPVQHKNMKTLYLNTITTTIIITDQ